MLFHSFSFLLFFPLVTGMYFLIPKRAKQLWLLVASYYFYMSWNVQYGCLILLVTAIGYGGGLLLAQNKVRQGKRRLAVLTGSVLLCVGILFFFKYFAFAVQNINELLRAVGSVRALRVPDLILPVGISFYTFQTIGYLIDVWKGKTEAEKSFLRFALFVSFFPQLVAGPIERSSSLLAQLREPAEFDYDRVKDGLLLMLWGYFEKMWIADRAAILVDQVYQDYRNYSSGMLVFATVLFAVQIYCDFGGYSHIAIGAAQVLGIRLMDNFRQPYFAVNCREFWRRWHISLSSWFRDYLYFPLGGSRGSSGRTAINLMITFLVSGLWHGAGWHYVVWGAIHGSYQVAGRGIRYVSEAVQKRLPEKKIRFFSEKTRGLTRAAQICVTFILTDFAWLFFRADHLGRAVAMLRRIVQNGNWLGQFTDGTLFGMGLRRLEVYQLAFAIGVLLVVDILHESGISIRAWLAKQVLVIRWSIYMLVLLGFVVLLLQNYGRAAAEFLYFQF